MGASDLQPPEASLEQSGTQPVPIGAPRAVRARRRALADARRGEATGSRSNELRCVNTGPPVVADVETKRLSRRKVNAPCSLWLAERARRFGDAGDGFGSCYDLRGARMARISRSAHPLWGSKPRT